jgi:hypothetical protein
MIPAANSHCRIDDRNTNAPAFRGVLLRIFCVDAIAFETASIMRRINKLNACYSVASMDRARTVRRSLGERHRRHQNRRFQSALKRRKPS